MDPYPQVTKFKESVEALLRTYHIMDIDHFIEEKSIERNENVDEFVQIWKEVLQGLSLLFSGPYRGALPLGEFEDFSGPFLDSLKAAIEYFQIIDASSKRNIQDCHYDVFNLFLLPLSPEGKSHHLTAIYLSFILHRPSIHGGIQG